MRVHLENCQKKIPVRLTLLTQRAQFFLSQLAKTKKHRLFSKTEVNFRFVSDQEIKKWHKDYLQDPTPTDVIAFSMREGEKPLANEDVLGDIVISVDTAKRQAKQYAKKLNEELTLYMIHGVLHLLGYDDLVPKKKKVMDALQFSLLKSVLLARPYQGRKSK